MDHGNVRRWRKRRFEGIIRSLALNRNGATVALDRLPIRQIGPGFYYILCILEDYFSKKFADLMLTKTANKMNV